MNIIFETKFGSHLYGTNTEASDVDRKGVYIPSAKEILLHTYKDSINTTEGKQQHQLKNDCNCVDYEYFSLDKFIKMALQGETCAIDMLHSNLNHWYCYDNTWSYIHANRKDFYTKNMQAYLGYVKKQAAKYSIKGSRLNSAEKVYEIIKSHLEKCNITKFDKAHTVKIGEMIDLLPEDEFCKKDEVNKFYEIFARKFAYTDHVWNLKNSVECFIKEYGERAKLAKDNQGIDWKAMSHALRAGLQLEEIYETGDLKYPLKESKLLLDVKLGKLDFISVVQPLLENKVEKVQKLAEDSGLPEKADYAKWEEFIYGVYKNVVKNS